MLQLARRICPPLPDFVIVLADNCFNSPEAAEPSTHQTASSVMAAAPKDEEKPRGSAGGVSDGVGSLAASSHNSATAPTTGQTPSQDAEGTTGAQASTTGRFVAPKSSF